MHLLGFCIFLPTERLSLRWIFGTMTLQMDIFIQLCLAAWVFLVKPIHLHSQTRIPLMQTPSLRELTIPITTPVMGRNSHLETPIPAPVCNRRWSTGCISISLIESMGLHRHSGAASLVSPNSLTVMEILYLTAIFLFPIFLGRLLWWAKPLLTGILSNSTVPVIPTPLKP